MSTRKMFPLEIPQIIEGYYVCWRLRWFKPEPPGLYSGSQDFTYRSFYVDNNGNVMLGSYDPNFSVFYVYSYDVNGNMTRVFSTTESIWRPYDYLLFESTWGQNVSVSTATAGPYMVITYNSKIYVFRRGRKIWEWDLAYDGIQNKRFYLLAISPSGKYIASSIGTIGGVTDDSIVLYEGCSDRSMCPTPP